MAYHHDQESHRLSGQRNHRFYSNVPNLLFLGHRCLAYIMHSFVFWLQFTPLESLLRPTRRKDLSNRTYECSICGAVYCFNGYTFVLAVAATRPSTGQRACPAIALPDGFWKHSTWIDRTEADND